MIFGIFYFWNFLFLIFETFDFWNFWFKILKGEIWIKVRSKNKFRHEKISRQKILLSGNKIPARKIEFWFENAISMNFRFETIFEFEIISSRNNFFANKNVLINLKIYFYSLTSTLSAWLLHSHWALKSIVRETLFLDQLHDYSLLSLNSFLHPFLKTKFM